jgi:hypothetical protein
MYPHRIRLRGPWGCEPLAGRVRFRRRFGYPGRIDEYERVWLTFTNIAGTAEVRLNDQLLGRHEDGAGAFEFEVTRLLRPRNELIVEVGETAGQGESSREVALEVRCTAFLRDLQRITMLRGGRAELHVTGLVVGAAGRPLELYVVLDRSVAGYQVVTPTADGQPFEVVVADLPTDEWRAEDGRLLRRAVTVDLVNGAVVWYRDETDVTLPADSGPGG